MYRYILYILNINKLPAQEVMADSLAQAGYMNLGELIVPLLAVIL